MSKIPTKAQSLSQLNSTGSIPSSEFSKSLKDVNQLLGENRNEEALEALASMTGSAMSGLDKSKIANFVAHSQFNLGRYSDALSRFSDAADFCAQDNLFGQNFLEPNLGKIRCLLKMQRPTDASSEARSLMRRVQSNWSDYSELKSLTHEDLLERGLQVVPARPVRIPVALTRIGVTFRQEGYIDEAKRFFERVLELVPDGASRARQFLSDVLLQEGNAERAEKLARESLVFGGFRAKTVASWSIYFQARKALGKTIFDQELHESFSGVTVSGRVRLRAVSIIIFELRRQNDEHWVAFANQWVDNNQSRDPIVKLEMIKLLLSEIRVGLLHSEDPHREALRLVEIALEERGTTYNECIGLAKEVGRYRLVSEMSLSELRHRLDPIRVRYGDECWLKAAHSSALGMVDVSDFKGAEELFRILIRKTEVNSDLWSRAVWSLAKTQGSLGDHEKASEIWLVYVGNSKSKPHFRLQAFFNWIRSSEQLGAEVDLDRATAKIRSLINTLDGPRPLLDAGRQLALAGPRFTGLLDEVIVEAEKRSKESFNEASTTQEALVSLLPLARRQFYDFRRSQQVIAFYEGLSHDKLSWLWSKSGLYWEYLSIVMRSYFQEGLDAKGNAFGRMCIDDSTVPVIGRVHLGVHYAEWLMENGNFPLSERIFQSVASESPTHRLSARAFYWGGLLAYSRNNTEKAFLQLGLARRCLLPSPSLLSEWEIDCKSVILLRDLSNEVSPATNLDRYSDDFIAEQKLCLSDDLRLVSKHLRVAQ